MWGRRARRTSQPMKKPIESLLIILRPFLNTLMLVESITCCGKLFHRSITRSEKKKHLNSNEQWFFRTLAEWPLVLVTELSVKKPAKWSQRQSFVHTENFRQISTVSSLFKCPQTQLCKTSMIWQLLHSWNHTGEPVLYTFQQDFVLDIMGCPSRDAVLQMQSD